MERPPSVAGARSDASGASTTDAPPAVVHVEVDDDRRCGQWIDLRDAGVDAATVADAVRGDRPAAGAVDDILVRCPEPGPAFEYVGTITPDTSPELRAALAAVARRRGRESSRESELATVRDELAALSVEGCDASAARRAVAEAGGAERELAERVATLRGRLQASGDDNEGDEARNALETTVRELAELRTERIAAEQRLARERERARTVRDRRERRLELQDRERNLERAVRADLAEAVYPAFVDTLAAVPGAVRPGTAPSEYRGDGVAAALALARLSTSAAPVVIAVDRFASPAAAARRLGRAVLRV